MKWIGKKIVYWKQRFAQTHMTETASSSDSLCNQGKMAGLPPEVYLLDDIFSEQQCTTHLKNGWTEQKMATPTVAQLQEEHLNQWATEMAKV